MPIQTHTPCHNDIGSPPVGIFNEVDVGRPEATYPRDNKNTGHQ